MNSLGKTIPAILLVACATTAGTAHAQIAFRAASSAALEATTITLRGAGAAAEVNPAGTGACAASQFITPAIPAGSNGDLLVAVVHNRDGATLTPSGAAWTTLHSDDQANHRTRAYWRRATGTDTLSVTKTGTCTANGVMIGQVARYNGVDFTQPFEPVVRFGYQTAAAVVNHAGGTINATVANSLSLFAAMVSDNNTVNAPTPATFTAAFNTQTGTGTDATIALFHKLETTTGNKGPYASTMSATDPSTGMFAIVRPALGLTIPVPAGTAVGDVMIASVTVRPCSNAALPCTVTVTAHADWTLVDSRLQTAGGGTGGNGNQLFVYRRVVTGTEPVAYTWTFGGAPVQAGAAGGILSFSGVDTANPIVDQLGALTTSASSHTAPQINTGTVTNTMLVSTHASNSSTTWAFPGGMTERVDESSRVPTDDLGLAIEINTELRAAAGLTGTRTATYTTPGTPANDTGTTHMLALRPGIPVSHYAISVLSTTVANCDYAEVTITAHNAAHAAVNPPSGRTVTLSVSAGAATAVWQPTLVLGTGAWTPAGATATYLWPGSESTFTVRLRQSAVVSLTVNANDTFVSEAGTEDPTISFVNSVFRISNGANAALSIGTQIAGKPSNTGVGTQSLFLQAIRTDTVTGACTSIFPSGSEVDIGVGAQCNNPATCTRNVTLTTTSGTGSPTGSFVPTGAGTYPATIRFRFTTANAEAPFYFSYADAGQITLQFRHITSAPAVTIAGTSNAFVVRPFAMYSQVTGNPGANTPSGAVFTSAGTDFSANVNSVAWQSADDGNNDGIPDSGADLSDNAVTPNFAYATTITAVAPYEPSSGTLGVLNNGTLAAGTFSSGLASPANLQYTEVGSFSLTTAVTDYLGDANADVAGLAVVVGRFIPDHFDVTKNAPRFQPACASGEFSYIGQSFGYEAGQESVATVTAMNALGATTRNYTGSWRRLTNTTLTPGTQAGRYAAFAGTLDASSLPAVSGDPAIADLTGGSLGSFTLTFSSAGGLMFTRATPVVPFDADIGLSINVIDADGIAYSSNPLTFGAATAGNGILFGGAGTPKQMRFGRLRLNNAFGSALLDLPLPLSIQYYDGSFFVTNTADSCTTLSASDIAFSFLAATPNLIACETHLNPAGVIAFASGIAAVRLTKPGYANNGAVDLTVSLGAVASGNTCTSATSSAATAANKTWLQGDWGSGSHNEDPRARATFGIFKNADQFLYFREVY